MDPAAWFEKNLFPVLSTRFPLSKPQLASKWVHSLGMKSFIPTANTCLCSEHFRTDCFRDYNGKQFLREDAVPTIFTQAQDSSKVQAQNTDSFTSHFTSLLRSFNKVWNFHRLNSVKEEWYQRRPTLQIRWGHQQTETEWEKHLIYAERREGEWGWALCDYSLYPSYSIFIKYNTTSSA